MGNWEAEKIFDIRQPSSIPACKPRAFSIMTIYSIIFYILAIVILVTTALAITRRDLVHAVVYLIFSFFGSAMLFYLFGAPFLAVLEVIIYAGAIMVLFLFIVIMLKVGNSRDRLFPLSQWLPAACLRAGLPSSWNCRHRRRSERQHHLEKCPGRTRSFRAVHIPEALAFH